MPWTAPWRARRWRFVTYVIEFGHHLARSEPGLSGRATECHVDDPGTPRCDVVLHLCTQPGMRCPASGDEFCDDAQQCRPE